jgi:hypothetical protein
LDLSELLDQLYKLSPGYLFADPRGVHSPLYVPAAVFFAIVFLGAMFALLFRERLSDGNRLHLRIIERYGTWAASLSAWGLLTILVRYASVPVFSKRAWTVLAVLAVIGVFVHFLWYRIKFYPEQLADYLEAERKRRFFPTARRTTSVRRGRRRH